MVRSRRPRGLPRPRPRTGIALGDEWTRRLHERLRWANALVCVLTNDYLSSDWCAAELGTARMLGTRVLPLKAEPDVTHPLLTEVQHPPHRPGRRPRPHHTGPHWPDGRALSEVARQRPLLVIDQLEELFTLSDVDARAEFAQRLCDTGAHIVCTIRPEHLTQLLNDAYLSDLCKHACPVTPQSGLTAVLDKPFDIACGIVKTGLPYRETCP